MPDYYHSSYLFNKIKYLNRVKRTVEQKYIIEFLGIHIYIKVKVKKNNQITERQ